MENHTECNASDLADPVEPKYCEVPNWVMIIQGIYLSVVSIGSCIGNLFVLFLVMKYKNLRYRSILVCLSVVICDLLILVFVHFTAILSVINYGWILGSIGCQLVGYTAFFLIYVRWMSMTVISLDRFSFIFFSLSYQRWSKPYLILLTIGSWGIPILMTAPTLAGNKSAYYTFRPGLFLCILECGLDTVCNVTYDTLLTLLLLFGAILPSVLYTIIYCFSRRKRRKIQMGSLADLTINNTQNWSKRDMQALITFVLILIEVILSNVPVYLLTFSKRYFSNFYNDIPIWIRMITIDFFYLSPLLDPLLILRNRDIYRAIQHLYRSSKPKQRRSSTVRRGSTISRNNNVITTRQAEA